MPPHPPKKSANVFAADQNGFDHACNILRSGGLVAFPTETVYGLGADATNSIACASIYEAKGRPSFNPLIVHFPNSTEAEKRVIFTVQAKALAQSFWPGPMTLVLARKSDCDIAKICSAGLNSLAVRVPGHPIAHQLLEKSQLPLAAPSANASGKISPTTAEHVVSSLGARVPCILEGPACSLGLESTVIDLTGPIPVLLRPGSLTQTEIESVIGPIKLGQSLMESKAEKPSQATAPELKSPGLLKSHYAPSLPLRLNATTVQPDEALLAFGPAPLTGAATMYNLSEKADLREAAANLFAALHDLDSPKENHMPVKIRGIAAMSIPHEGLGLAINDRLKRAAAPR
ncbi:L-threonylcarbamoyladenylate synthase [Kiloniella antarctica]|uniref:Threonylcarbamoyl-AMP synthase n=1 Tax=Kiloniella antarctica TaxID=1550907 RepID=A0ABW5BS21_9PROT